MARRPAIAEGFLHLRRAVMDPEGTVPVGLKGLIAHVASLTAGCRYCQAHSIFGAERAGVERSRLEEIWDFETSGHFTDGERAALRVAAGAAAVPNAVSDEDFAELRAHWSEDHIVEILAVVALFGFLNRWNDTLGTALEAPSEAAATGLLGGRGWDPGKHAGTG
jgi:alkylhydroperoxidase family enzyme